MSDYEIAIDSANVLAGVEKIFNAFQGRPILESAFCCVLSAVIMLGNQRFSYDEDAEHAKQMMTYLSTLLAPPASKAVH
jgi:hypothetical protein